MCDSNAELTLKVADKSITKKRSCLELGDLCAVVILSNCYTNANATAKAFGFELRRGG
jgi:hypothetical protein